jgi:hypothetical protein
MGNLLIGIGALLCGWLLLFGRAESTSRRWIGFLTAAVTVALLAWLLWGAAGQSMLGASLLGMPFGMQILFPTGIFIYAAIIWVGLALARALVIGDPAVVPPASHAARGRLLLAALLVVVCFQQLALGGMYYHGLALLLAAPFLVAIGYLGLIQLVQALGALGLTHSTAVPTIYRRHLNRWMIVLLALFGLGPVIIFAGCVLLLGLMFGGAHFN